MAVSPYEILIIIGLIVVPFLLGLLFRLLRRWL
jgi:hypothetical protein